jgi:TRAP-type C4-dicarboxylate transport system permease small subunit
LPFKRALAKASLWLAKVEWASIVLSSMIIFALMCLVSVDVVGRKLFNSPVQGALEVTELALPAIVYLGLSYVQAHQEHIKLELVSFRLPLIKWWGSLLSITLMLAMCTTITVKIGQYAWESWSISDHTMGIVHIPIWPAKSAAFFGFFLLSLRLTIQLLELITNKKGCSANEGVVE